MHKTYKFKLKAYYEKIVEKYYKSLINNKYFENINLLLVNKIFY